MKDYVRRHEEQLAECVLGAGGGGSSKKTNQQEVSEVDILLGTHNVIRPRPKVFIILPLIFNLVVNLKKIIYLYGYVSGCINVVTITVLI